MSPMMKQGVSGVVNLRPTLLSWSTMNLAHKLKYGGEPEGHRMYYMRTSPIVIDHFP